MLKINEYNYDSVFDFNEEINQKWVDFLKNNDIMSVVDLRSYADEKPLDEYDFYEIDLLANELENCGSDTYYSLPSGSKMVKKRSFNELKEKYARMHNLDNERAVKYTKSMLEELNYLPTSSFFEKYQKYIHEANKIACWVEDTEIFNNDEMTQLIDGQGRDININEIAQNFINDILNDAERKIVLEYIKNEQKDN